MGKSMVRRDIRLDCMHNDRHLRENFQDYLTIYRTLLCSNNIIPCIDENLLVFQGLIQISAGAVQWFDFAGQSCKIRDSWQTSVWCANYYTSTAVLPYPEQYTLIHSSSHKFLCTYHKPAREFDIIT